MMGALASSFIFLVNLGSITADATVLIEDDQNTLLHLNIKKERKRSENPDSIDEDDDEVAEINAAHFEESMKNTLQKIEAVIRMLLIGKRKRWTALHWASRFGSYKMGTKAKAEDDPLAPMPQEEEGPVQYKHQLAICSYQTDYNVELLIYRIPLIVLFSSTKNTKGQLSFTGFEAFRAVEDIYGLKSMVKKMPKSSLMVLIASSVLLAALSALPYGHLKTASHLELEHDRERNMRMYNLIGFNIDAKLETREVVLSLPNGGQSGSRISQPDINLKTNKPVVQMSDIIDMNYANENDNSVRTSDENAASLMDDFFGHADVHVNQPANNDDLFANVQTNQPGNNDDPFAGGQWNLKNNVNVLMAGLSVNGNESSPLKNGTPKTLFSNPTTNPYQQVNDVLSNMLQFQAQGITPNPRFPMDPNTYNALSSGLMFNPMAYASQLINYAAMSNLLAQQQYLSNLQS
ncbi:hypothetical protein Tco_0902716 [Tanacetum coccineum]